jgi:cytochrome c5
LFTQLRAPNFTKTTGNCLTDSKRFFIQLFCATALVACGKPEPGAPSAAAPTAAQVQAALSNAPPVVPVPVAAVAPEHQDGKRVFDKNCGLCHGAGFGGAPRPGDKANWAPRIAQGVDTLYHHATVGYAGAAGYMPAWGGAGVSDADIKAGVDYMVSLSR